MQLEEPFSILPLEALCTDIRVAAEDMLDGRTSTRAPLPLKTPLRRPPRQRTPRTSAAGPRMMVMPPDASAVASAVASAFAPGVGGAALAAASDTASEVVRGFGPGLLAALSTVEQEERYFLAGGLCASISHALATPIDVVKTKQQTIESYQASPLRLPSPPRPGCARLAPSCSTPRCLHPSSTRPPFAGALTAREPASRARGGRRTRPAHGPRAHRRRLRL